MVASDLYSTVSYGGAVQTRGLNIFCAHVFKRLPLGFSVFFFVLFFFVDVGNRTNVFFVQEHILAKFGALRARSFNSRDRSL